MKVNMCHDYTGVYLRTVDHDDIHAIGKLRYNNDRWFFSHAYVSDGTQENWYNKLCDDSSNLAFIAGVDGVHDTVGFGMIYDVDQVNNRCAVGMCIDSNYRKNGYGSALVRLLTQYAFVKLGMNKIVAEVMTNNIPSARIFVKLGYTLVGIRPKHYYKNRKWVDVAIYELLWDDYASEIEFDSRQMDMFEEDALVTLEQEVVDAVHACITKRTEARHEL